VLVQVPAEKSGNTADRNLHPSLAPDVWKKTPMNSGAQRVLDNKKEVTGFVELYSLQLELCG